MSKFTKGTWQVNILPEKIGISDGNKRLIAVLPNLDGEDMANADLISAAPEMYRECALALEMINHMALDNAHFASSPGYNNMKHRLETTLSKARGEK